MSLNVPNYLKSQEMCDRVAEKYQVTIRLVFDYFITHLIKLC